MNVLILMPLATQRGGSELMLLDLLRHAPREQVQWSVVFFREGPLVDSVRAMGIDTYVVDTGRLRHVHRYIGAIRQLISLIAQENIELVLSWATKAHLYGGVAALLSGVDAAWYQFGYPEGRHVGWMDRLATALPAKAVITVSEHTQEAQERLWPSRPTRAVRPSVRIEQFDPDQLPSPQEARRRLDLPDRGPLVGIVGRLQRWKGMHTLVEAMPDILDAHPDAHAVIVGGQDDAEPDYTPFLDQLIADRGLQDEVIRVGFQSNVPLWMQAMDVVVHASDREPFGIVILEAMALGKPVVAGDEGGPREIITENENGLLAPYEDADQLAHQILRYLRNPDLARRLGRNARTRALDFTPEKYARRCVNVVQDLVAPPPSAPEKAAVPPRSARPREEQPQP
jgi:glycosyltransferase involved in cell wall biosynthesis